MHLFVPDKAGNVAETIWEFTTEVRTEDVIRDFTDNTDRVQRFGDTLHLEMNGAPRGTVTFSLGNIRDIPLREVSPGHYAADYVLRESDDPSSSRLMFRMVTANGQRYVHQTERALRLLPPPPMENVPNGPVITTINLVPDNPSGWLQAGQRLVVQMEGTPRGLATFHVADITGEIPMSEISRGHYAGFWRVPNNQKLQRSELQAIVSLTFGNETTRRTPTNQTVALDMVWPVIYARTLTPRRDSQTSEMRPTIVATFDDPNGSGVDRKRIRLEVNGRDVTSAAAIRPDSISYAPRDALAPGRQNVHLQVSDKAGNVAETTWSFTVSQTVTDAIKSIRTNGDKAMQPGEVLHVEMMGLPGSSATFTVGNIQDVPMPEISAGRYAADYTIRKRDLSDNAHVTVRLTTANGTRFAQESRETLTIQPPKNVPDILPSVKSLILASSNRSGFLQAGQRLTVTLEGVQGGTATFHINQLTGELPLRESAPGHYTANWTVPQNTELQRGDLILIASLTVGGQTKRVQAQQNVAIDTIWPVISQLSPARDSQTTDIHNPISASFADPNGSGVDKAKVRLEINGKEVTSGATIRPDSIIYIPKDGFKPGKQTIHLIVPDKAGNVAETTWFLTVK